MRTGCGPGNSPPTTPSPRRATSSGTPGTGRRRTRACSSTSATSAPTARSGRSPTSPATSRTARSSPRRCCAGRRGTSRCWRSGGEMTFAPPITGDRAALGGHYAPLSANAQGISQETAERIMRAGVKVWRPRFELYDVVGHRLLPDLKVTAATVDYDDNRELKGAMDIELLADERLRDGFLQ